MDIDFIYIGIVIAVVLVSIVFHEAMHAFASYWLGDDTAKLSGRLSLNPIRHIDPFLTIILPVMMAILGGPIFGGAKPVPINYNKVRWDEWGVALVAFAGPFANLFIAFIAYGCWSLIGFPKTGIVGTIVVTTVYVNLGFFVFNMIPIPPLDGSRVMYALAPEFVRRGMEYIERFGIMIVFALLFIAGPSFSLFMSVVIKFLFDMFGSVFGS